MDHMFGKVSALECLQLDGVKITESQTHIFHGEASAPVNLLLHVCVRAQVDANGPLEMLSVYLG